MGPIFCKYYVCCYNRMIEEEDKTAPSSGEGDYLIADGVEVNDER